MSGEIVIKVPKESSVDADKKEITIKYFNLGFKFDMTTWYFLSGYTGVDFKDFGNLKEETFVYKLLYSAARRYMQVYGQDYASLTEEQVIDYTKRISQHDLNSVMQCMIDSRVGGEKISELYREGQEKKKLRIWKYWNMLFQK